MTSLTAGGDREPSVAVDGQGGVHVVYSREGSGLFHVTNPTGAWVTTRISTGPEDRQPSLALDALGRVHVAFWRGPLETGQGVWYVTNTSGTWKVSPVQTDASSFLPSLDLDADGHAHIAFNNAAGGVRYATRRSGSWVTTQVTRSGRGSSGGCGSPRQGACHLLVCGVGLVRPRPVREVPHDPHGHRMDN